MKTKLFIFLALITHLTFAQSQIEGYVTNGNNDPVTLVEVQLKEVNKSVVTDKNGFFQFKNLTKGDYTLTVSYKGYETITKEVQLEENKTEQIAFNLSDNLRLEQVEVFGERFKHPDKIEALTRLPLSPYEQIQSISIISSKLIEQQGNLTISDATKNVPGIYTFATYGNKRESMSSRGFRGIPILKNGVRVHSDFRGVGILTDMQGVDNIQVLKGAAAITQGVATDLGSPGGVVNLVTKTPKYNSGGNISLRAGSFGQARTTFDVYGPLTKTKTTAFRINGALERSDSYRSRISSDRFYINPSFEWKPDEKTTVTLEMDYFEDARTPDVGTINLAEDDENNIYDLPYNQYLGFKNDKSLTTNTTYAIRVNRELNDKLTLKGAFYKSNLDLDDKGSTLLNGNKDKIKDDLGATIHNLRKRGYSASTRNDNNSVIQFDLIGDDVKTGSISHTFQVGVDYRTSDYNTTSQSISTIDTINVFSQNNNILPNNLDLGNKSIRAEKSKSLGFVAQDVVIFNKYLKAFIGIRYSKTRTTSETATTESDAFNPLVGVIVSPFKNVNVFASYTNSSYPRTGTRTGENGEELGNERYDQIEGGIKTNWLNNRLRFNLTYFKINNKNINLPVYDSGLQNILYYAKGGNDQRQGLEVELTGRVLNNLEIITGYSYIDAQYKEHTSYVSGSAPLNTPKHTFNAYANYSFKQTLEGLSLGAGVYYTGERPVNDWAKAIANQTFNPGVKPFVVKAYTQVNIQAAYKINKHWDARLLLNNVFNQIGYNAYRTSYINQTDPRNFAGVLTYRF